MEGALPCVQEWPSVCKSPSGSRRPPEALMLPLWSFAAASATASHSPQRPGALLWRASRSAVHIAASLLSTTRGLVKGEKATFLKTSTVSMLPPTLPVKRCTKFLKDHSFLPVLEEKNPAFIALANALSETRSAPSKRNSNNHMNVLGNSFEN